MGILLVERFPNLVYLDFDKEEKLKGIGNKWHDKILVNLGKAV